MPTSVIHVLLPHGVESTTLPVPDFVDSTLAAFEYRQPPFDGEWFEVQAIPGQEPKKVSRAHVVAFRGEALDK